jgi:hypothetical protein
MKILSTLVLLSMSSTDSKWDNLKEIFRFHIEDVATLLFVSWPKFTLPKVLYGKVHCYDAKCTCLAKVLVCSDKCVTVNISELGGLNASVIILNEQFIMDKFFNIMKQISMVLTSVLRLEDSGIFDWRLCCFVSGSSSKIPKSHHHSLVIFKRL